MEKFSREVSKLDFNRSATTIVERKTELDRTKPVRYKKGMT